MKNQSKQVNAILDRLRNLQKYSAYSGDFGPYASQVDFEKDNTHGYLVKFEDLETIIKEFTPKQ